MYCGLFNEAGVLPKRKITRFYVSPESILEPGKNLIKLVYVVPLVLFCILSALSMHGRVQIPIIYTVLLYTMV